MWRRRWRGEWIRKRGRHACGMPVVVIFVRVNQVLVRLWACLVAMSDRLVGCGRAIGYVWLACNRGGFRGVNVLC